MHPVIDIHRDTWRYGSFFIEKEKFVKINAINGKNGFAEVSKNLASYRSKNNFVWIIKIIM